jgi:transcriptional regulator with XRE-family HTH domain
MSELENRTANITRARELLQEWMRRKNQSAAQLSRESGLKQYTISRILNGKVDEIELQTATKLYQAIQDDLTEDERRHAVHWLGLGTLWAALRDGGASEWLTELAGKSDREAARGMVKAWMRERGASQADLARRAEIDPSRVGRFLRGRIEAKTAARIYRAVHAELDATQRLALLHGLGLYEIAEALAPLLRERE